MRNHTEEKAEQHILELGGIVQPLLQWYDKNARILPWRENTEPYRVWVSEIMLQQTRVEAVKPYYERFMAQLPSVQHLAVVEEETLLKLWEGLGYYARVRNLQKAAQMICREHGGVFPREYDRVRELPGIGEYTAGAICSISFGLPTPAVDGNVLRVLARITEDYSDILAPACKKRMTQALQQVFPQTRCGEFTQSLMELGAMVCIPTGTPKCRQCPLAQLCKANAHHTQPELPVKAEKKPRKIQEKTILLLRCGNKIAVQKREEKGLLSGMWEFPNIENFLTVQEVEAWISSLDGCPCDIKICGTEKHIFTHIEWRMQAVSVYCDDEFGPWNWVTAEQLDASVPLPTAFKKFVKYLQ